MTTPELLQYVRTEQAAGVPLLSIQKTLLDKGWSVSDVADALRVVAPVAVPPPVQSHASRLGTKLFLMVGLVGASAAYVLWQYASAAGTSPVALQTPGAPTVATPSSVTAAPIDPTPIPPASTTPAPATVPAAKPKPTPAPKPTPKPVPAPKPVVPAGQYRDGSYTGSTADAYYGTVQVQAVVTGGKLASVSFLQYPSDRSTSRYINSQAMPMLEQEAIQVQSANVQIISGATDTSMAFQQSLGAALANAKN